MSAEEVWDHIEKAYETSRKHNKEVLTDQIAAASATALCLNSQMLAAGLLNPGPEIESEDIEDETGADEPAPGEAVDAVLEGAAVNPI